MTQLFELTNALQLYKGYQPKDLEIFNQFINNTNLVLEAQEGYIVDFLGVKIWAESLADSQRVFAGQVLPLPVPGDYHAEAIEYIGLLKSVFAAIPSGQYRVMELGAGWGPWLVNGASAARSLGIQNISMLGVEADKGHYSSMLRHLRDNGFLPEEHKMYWAAVGATNGKATFPMIIDHANQWGGRPAKIVGGVIDEHDSAYLGNLTNTMVDIDVLAINDLLNQDDFWDLVHIDVQGWEAEICSAAIETLTAKVRYIIIGTHSRLLDGQIMKIFHDARWVLENEKPTQFNYNEACNELESMTWADGTQVWRNPNV